MNWKEQFPQFETGLIDVIEKEAVQREYNAGDIIMRTGQYIKSTTLVLKGQIKIYRENNDGGEFLMYYLGPGEACDLSLIHILPLQVKFQSFIHIAESDIIYN